MSGNSIVFGEEIRILVFLKTHVIWSTDIDHDIGDIFYQTLMNLLL